jgi:hypothetical protein
MAMAAPAPTSTAISPVPPLSGLPISLKISSKMAEFGEENRKRKRREKNQVLEHLSVMQTLFLFRKIPMELRKLKCSCMGVRTIFPTWRYFNWIQPIQTV